MLSVVGCLVTLVGLLYTGTILYLDGRETASPSTSRVLVLKDGTRIPLAQPQQPSIAAPATAVFASPMPTWTLPGTAEAQQGGTAGGGATPQPQAVAPEVTPAPERQVLPPVRISIGGIGADWPVVLSNGVQLPRFKALGWLLGSAYPGAPGNMVLFGHLDGNYATLERLKDLKPGAVFSVFTDSREYLYKVRSSFQTTPDDVGVMAPTDGATATIITCSGRWDRLDSMYDHRLIVVADYVEKP